MSLCTGMASWLLWLPPLDHPALVASLPSLVHDVEPVTHNGKLCRGFHTTLTAERQTLQRPRTLVTAPTRLSSQLWPKGPHIREPTTIPTRDRETSRRHLRALYLPCLRALTKNLPHIWHPSFCGCHPDSLDLVASWAVWTGTGGQQQTKTWILTCYCVRGQSTQAADRNTHAPVVPRGLMADVKSHCLTVWLAVSLNPDADQDPALWGTDRSAHPLHDWESLRMKQAARTKTKCWETTKRWGRGEWQGLFPRRGEAAVPPNA